MTAQNHLLASAALGCAAAAVLLWPQPAAPAGRVRALSIRRPRLSPVLAVVIGTLAATFAGGPLVGAAGLFLAATLTALLRRAARRRRRAAQLDDERQTLVLLGRELRAGSDLTRAATELIPVVTPHGRQLLQRLAIDAADDLHSADQLSSMGRRLAMMTRLAGREGIAIAEVVQSLVLDADARARAAADRRQQTAGPRFSGYALAAMPVLGLLIGGSMGADPLRVLFGAAPGGLLLPVGTALSCAGLLWVDRIVS